MPGDGGTKVAVISGACTVVAAVIGGIFLLASTRPDTPSQPSQAAATSSRNVESTVPSITAAPPSSLAPTSQVPETPPGTPPPTAALVPPQPSPQPDTQAAASGQLPAEIVGHWAGTMIDMGGFVSSGELTINAAADSRGVIGTYEESGQTGYGAYSCVSSVHIHEVLEGGAAFTIRPEPNCGGGSLLMAVKAESGGNSVYVLIGPFDGSTAAQSIPSFIRV